MLHTKPQTQKLKLNPRPHIPQIKEWGGASWTMDHGGGGGGMLAALDAFRSCLPACLLRTAPDSELSAVTRQVGLWSDDRLIHAGRELIFLALERRCLCANVRRANHATFLPGGSPKALIQLRCIHFCRVCVDMHRCCAGQSPSGL